MDSFPVGKIFCRLKKMIMNFTERRKETILLLMETEQAILCSSLSSLSGRADKSNHIIGDWHTHGGLGKLRSQIYFRDEVQVIHVFQVLD